MAEISALTRKFAQKLIQNSEECEAFLGALQVGACRDRAVLWLVERVNEVPWQVESGPEWRPTFVDRVGTGARPGSHPLHEQGAFYCLDFSSVFSASAVCAFPELVGAKVVDICAAPGGKSIFAWRAASPSILISNEVIGKRTGALISNLVRCKIRNARVVRHDPEVLAEILGTSADLVIVDAPCSGQSLIAKGEDSPGCFHPATINMNANRQRRIISNSAKVVAGGGMLMYMTCTYAREENEGVLEWFVKKNPSFRALSVPHLEAHHSTLSSLPCYRLWPQQGLGAGAFVAVLRCEEERDCGGDESKLHVLWDSSASH
ncbi:MAG: RsmB/NOP family class I SAM-dependent RNA methyltransferase [Oligoflexia bacterium]|nr:RsmB/NOP family class I SAM-dependent RNA methyltransferase [Oligoflexia bacterium]